MVRNLKRNKVNLQKLEQMIKHINGYLQINQFKTLSLELSIQDGVIQIVRINEIDKRKSIKI
jgi:hypothetical protein